MAEGHRNRLKNRFLHQGLDGFEPHNALELLLFFTIPRCDTNPIAHELIERFGSFSGVLDADYDELKKVKGISSHTATMIKLLPDLFRFYQNDLNKEAIVFKNIDEVGEYMRDRFIGINREAVYVMLLNNGNQMLSCFLAHQGSITSAGFDTRRIILEIAKKNASTIVLAHNHPNGVPVPSPEDIDFTSDFSRSMSLIRVEFAEHFVIAQNRYCGIIKKQKENGVILNDRS